MYNNTNNTTTTTNHHAQPPPPQQQQPNHNNNSNSNTNNHIPNTNNTSPLTYHLLNVQNATTQKNAEDQLRIYEQTNLPEFVRALASELADVNKPPLASQMAGMILKNLFFDDRSEALQQRKSRVWTSLADPIKAGVRECALQALVSPHIEARKASAQLIGAIGVWDIPMNTWPTLPESLFKNVTSAHLTDDVKCQTLTAIGILSVHLKIDHVPNTTVNIMLTCIIESMKAGKADILRVEATRALLPTLSFARNNMNRENERNQIVLRICEASIVPNIEIRRLAFDCMATLANEYYHVLPAYMDTFYRLTFQAVQQPDTHDEKVALAALEFWCALCEQETQLNLLNMERKRANQDIPLEEVCQNYVLAASKTLFELIAQHCLMKQPSTFLDDDEWNIHLGGITLLRLMSECLKDQIVPVVTPFVSHNVEYAGPDNWRRREAALMAFAQILDGPSSDSLRDFVSQGLSFFLQELDRNNEPNDIVRNTAGTVISHICEFQYVLLEKNIIPVIARSLVTGLQDKAKIASTCAGAIQNLCISVDHADDTAQSTNVLSGIAVQTLPVLVVASERVDWADHNLRCACFEAINCYVQASGDDILSVIGELLGLVLRKLNMALHVKVETSSQKEEVEGMIQYCIGTVLVISQRVREHIAPKSHEILSLVIAILSVNTSAAAADAFIVMGDIANHLGNKFAPYVQEIMPHVIKGLRLYDEYQVCRAAAEACGDIARNVGDAYFRPYANAVMELFLLNLANTDLNRDVKPPTLSAVGDVACALGGEFKPYMGGVLQVLEAASTLHVPDGDPDMVDYMIALRDANLEAYTGIIQNLGINSVAEIFLGPNHHLKKLLEFIAQIAVDCNDDNNNGTSLVSINNVKQAVGILGDLARALNQPAKQQIAGAMNYYQVLFDECFKSGEQDATEVANWAISQIKA
jgi:importin subunit beta-1